MGFHLLARLHATHGMRYHGPVEPGFGQKPGHEYHAQDGAAHSDANVLEGQNELGQGGDEGSAGIQIHHGHDQGREHGDQADALKVVDAG